MRATREAVIRRRMERLRDEVRRLPVKRQVKPYLSRADRREVMLLAAIAGTLDELVAGWEERGRPGVLLRAGKLARYWAYQALDAMLVGIDQDSIDRLMRAIGRAQIIVTEE